MRARIVAAGAELLAEGGRGALTTRAVAAAAGVQAPTIYRLFGDERGLLEAVAERGLAKHIAQNSRSISRRRRRMCRSPLRSRIYARAGISTSKLQRGPQPVRCKPLLGRLPAPSEAG
ncbi:TetR family transcriptional regulator [Sorangium sp. So ce1389]|uniref:TetR family transcriptional regulator n=1 Tax=Sorangium sp. So ce1389 TaxID=3133336 RepID=UPI003F5F6960